MRCIPVADYGKRGVQQQRRALQNTSKRVANKVHLSLFNLILITILALCITLLSFGIGIFRGIISSAPEIGDISVTPKGFSTFVYDVDGNQTAKLVSSDSNRIPVTSDMIPANLKHAFVAIEDSRFYKHNGVDIQGIFRAAGVALKNGNLSEGASTITQQLLKNNVFSNWTNESKFTKIKRKIQEQYLAVQLEKKLKHDPSIKDYKDDILVNYLNTINLGQNTLGVQAASLRYFGKSVSELNLSECACIAAITQNPSKYNPISHPEENAKRREKVLNDMLKQGYITQEEHDSALADDVYSRIQVIDAKTQDTSVNSYFVDSLTNEVVSDLVDIGYNETQAYALLYSGGLKIYSTQDPKIQSIADEVIANPDNYPGGTVFLLNYQLSIKGSDGKTHNYSSEMMESWLKETGKGRNLLYRSQDSANAAIDQFKSAMLSETGGEVLAENIHLVPQPQVSVTIEDQHTGYVVAVVGGRGNKEASRTLNRATDTVRQPGSTFKIVSTYAPALDAAGLTLATVIKDAPFYYTNGRQVRNWYGESYRGLTSLRTAIEQSMNVIAVKTLTWITPQLGFDYLKKFGFTTLVDHEEIGGRVYSDIQQTMALGGLTKGVKNIELNAAFASIADGGVYIKPKLYTKIVDHDGNVLLDNTDPKGTQILKPTTAYLLTSAMEDVVTKGTGKSVNFGKTQIAGKTGTTSKNNDVWFAGYSNYYTATTWVGYDDNTKLGKGQTSLAKVLWKGIMSKIHEDLPSSNFEKPDGIVEMTVCSKSGKLPIAGLCDATLKKEIFAKDTVPTDPCDVHYSGSICAYSGAVANDYCPFHVQGVFTLDPVEAPSLAQGSGRKSANSEYETDAEGRQRVVRKRCEHDLAFWSQPNVESKLAQEFLQVLLRNGYPQNDATVALAAQNAQAALQAYYNGTLASFSMISAPAAATSEPGAGDVADPNAQVTNPNTADTTATPAAAAGAAAADPNAQTAPTQGADPAAGAAQVPGQ
ncbi:MAG: transglycosylase domain-containing protein [Lachnospiraceae bacterium]|nr:transglycosylase domain-containing protein [Lachnospiraceae bacterium]